MLNLSAAHLRILRESAPDTRLVWIDIGGGTGMHFTVGLPTYLISALPGYNIELMNKHIPISSFDAIYLIDLCEPLLQVARKRFAARGWNNVTVLCQDATEFSLPEWADGSDPKGSVSFVTLSYSLSMVNTSTMCRYTCANTHYRFRVSTRCLTESTTCSHLRTVSSALLTSTLPGSNHRCMSGPLEAPRRSVDG